MAKTENALRHALKRRGYSLHKSRHGISLDNFGGYMICNDYNNAVVRGWRFDLNLDDVADFLAWFDE